MNSNNPKHVEARNMMVQTAIDEINDVKDFNDFYRRSFYIIAKLGHQLIAREEKLFGNEDWSNPECKDELIKKVRKFLVKHIK